jgi:CMP-N,N'-diacetyllegionaminic acid synthase
MNNNGNPLIYAIIPARSGSKGLPDKNIKMLAGKPLIAYSVNFAKALRLTKVICSTDSEKYAEIAKHFGAEVPFLRSKEAASDTAMEEDILYDLYENFDRYGIAYPDLFVWLRPTFIFRDAVVVHQCIDKLLNDDSYSAARTVCETEGRLYRLDNGILVPQFDDKGKSMIRRQETGIFYKVFSTDVFRGKPRNCGVDFLGRKVYGVEIPKICGLDIDDDEDFNLIENLIKNSNDVQQYLY